jgi:hypothetical protein
VSGMASGPSTPQPDWFSYDVLLHSRCGRTLAEHPIPLAPEVRCPFPELPPREFTRLDTAPASGQAEVSDADRETAAEVMESHIRLDGSLEWNAMQVAIAAALAAERRRAAEREQALVAAVEELADELDAELAATGVLLDRCVRPGDRLRALIAAHTAGGAS